MSEILREVDEAIKAEKWSAFWEEHKIALLTGIIALILGTGFYSGWNSWTTQQNRESTTQIIQAIQAKEASTELEKISKDLKDNAKNIAQLNLAGIHLKNNQAEKALAIYSQLITDKTADNVLTEFATIQKVSIETDYNSKATAKNLIDQLMPIAENKKSAWQGQAIFLMALIKAEKDKDFASASEGLKKLVASQSTAPSLQNRAKALLSIYESKKDKS